MDRWIVGSMGQQQAAFGDMVFGIWIVKRKGARADLYNFELQTYRASNYAG